ncbi:MAG TPA: 2'-5' RNA ligase family protein [Chthoniobacterales bacterium]
MPPDVEPPLVLTLGLDEAHAAFFNELRRTHFPPARNHLPAHLTLFHQLPGAVSKGIEKRLAELSRATPPFELWVSGLRFLGRGVAYTVTCPELVAFRQRLAAAWDPWLSAQDRHGLQPHITIQNKVAPAVAQALWQRLREEFSPFQMRGEHLLLWRYLGGPWESIAALPLSGPGR